MSLDALRFDNRFLADLPGDPSADPGTREVLGAAWSRVTPRTASAPELLAVSPEMLEALGLDPATVTADPRFVRVFAGNEALPGMEHHAANYGGHQFGHWAGQLGDGRAIVLGEVVTEAPDGGGRYTLQLKGAGPTPYSRRADGLAVLRSSVREFLCSEAMHHLGVPTTRALSLVTTGDQVWRDMFYDGRPEWEPGAVVCRVAPSFLRFGSFELFASRQDHDTLRAMVEHTIRVHFRELLPELPPEPGAPLGADVVLAWYREVVRRTLDMVVHWQRVGFVHGVMNTDNMSVHGLTIDYGPYGWLEPYDPGWTPNTTDGMQRRYAFGNQPRIAQWNLAMLGNAILPLLDGDAKPLQEAVDGYGTAFGERWSAMMLQKLGITEPDPEVDGALVSDLLKVLQQTETDMTLWFRRLGTLEVQGDGEPDRAALLAGVRDAWYQPDRVTDEVESAFADWLLRYAARLRALGTPDAERRAAMERVNPKFVLRNYLAQLAIDDAAKGDPMLIEELLDTLRRPYDEQDDRPDRARFAEKRPEWARSRPGCSSLSCSS